MNKITWAGIIIMVAAVLLYLGDLITDFARPALSVVAAVGGVLFVGGLVYAAVRAKQEREAAQNVTRPNDGPGL